MTAEPFYAAGLLPINMELVAGWLATLGLSKDYISKSEGRGFSSTLCSYHKATLGLIEDGGLPHPQGAAVSSHLCDGGVGVVKYFSQRYGADTLILNTPFYNSDTNSKYMVNEYTRLFKWIEDYTGRPIESNKLTEALSMSNQAREYWIKAFELRKGRPLFPGHLSLRNLFGATFLFGSSLGVEVAKAYYEQLLELGRQDDVPDKKKKRLLWIHFAPLYNNSIMEYLEKELNCWIVADITGYIYWKEYDLNKPMESLASRALSHFYLGSAEERKRIYQRLIEEYEIDGMIHFMHNGCRAIPGSSWQIRELANDLGIPYLELSGDCIDPRGFSEAQMKLRMEAFQETLGRV
nr:2-hydroxyacyl-CoA dehydratase family protein [Pelosinus baikalensis]